MSEQMSESQIPNINLESSKSNDVYEINFNVILIALAVVILLVVGFMFWKNNSTKTSGEVTPTPTLEVTLAPTSTPTDTPTPTLAKEKTSSKTAAKETATPTPASDKEAVKIQVLNGTGTAGDAAFLKTKLAQDGFDAANVTTGNAASTSSEAKTEVVYYPGFPSALKVNFTSLLNTLYASVSASNSTGDSKYDAVVTTGVKK